MQDEGLKAPSAISGRASFRLFATIVMEQRVESRAGLIEMVRGLLTQPGPDLRGRLPLLNLVGAPGMGKSYLLRQVSERMAPDHPVVTIDFATPITTWAAGSGVLAPLLPADGPGPEHPALAALGLALTARLPETISPEAPWLLLLDGLDDLEQWPAVQRTLIKPVAERTPALVLLASRAPLNWHFWELRERCQPVTLPQLVLDETLAIAKQAARGPLGRPLHDLALGHPAAIETLLRHFTGAPPPEGPEPRLGELSAPARAVVAVVGVMRSVQAPVMQRLLNRFLAGWSSAPTRTPRILQDVLIELKGRGHIDYNQEQRTVFTRALRRAVEAELRRDNPQRLMAIYHELEEIYYERLVEQPGAEPRAFNEWLYFSVMPLHHGQGSSERWVERLRGLCRRAAEAGADLPAQVYRDQDLIARLEESGCLDAVHAALLEHVPIDAAVFTQDAASYSRYVADLLRRLLSPASDEEWRRLDTLIDAARGVAEPFSAAQLASIIAARTGDTVHGVRRDLTTLADRGCCFYNPIERTYTLHPLLRRLLQYKPPATDAQQGAG